ncbi:MAG TPA: PBP1A family penicillin-binding protein [Candidatus Hydrogenedentes bacterium]|jgi:penicillin-binding protein 1A|nr:MAG: Penicillin-binding protein 1A [Candidatus Hydrogenedentes bacterium ADurb.Bin170]HNZ48580.1 PBP1A family penicillin-binding protein [Candidatus Hydrogenedentota bacterium]HOD96087.1 PBP1A family penicillin-binding protein [Candidatus Hydrogenedentota bacterium]HOH41622.1 PBP1A family penicillin-binding protein [Candidatus Hydrogenedentota bacterium]HOM48712.1 PBP1A family penicillin-binding protein [Candidatus Hydrogenedentota bacterium]
MGIFIALLLVVGAAWGAGLALFSWIIGDAQHDVSEALANFRPKVGTKVYSYDGQIIGEFSIEERSLVRLSDIPLHTQKAVLATEDSLFFEHKGVRPDAIISSILYGLQRGTSPRGGSTITQQVVRNVEDLKVGQERTYQRKLREALTALQIERNFTKDEILELYLNQIFLGGSAHGIEAASMQYFGKSCSFLTIAESATLAGLIRSPNRNSPFKNPDNALQRRNVVLKQMFENKFISKEEYDQAMQENLLASLVQPTVNRESIDYSVQGNYRAPYFVEEIRNFVLQRYEKQEVFEEGFEIYTTIDMRIQSIAEETLLSALDEFDRKMNKGRSPEDENYTAVSGALVCLDNRAPYRGQVRAMVGGRDFVREKFNTVTQAKRPPGSSIKPFIWAAAIASGMTPSTIIVDEPFVRRAPNGKIWAPKNFGGGFSGPVPLRYALERSINIVSIKLVERIGLPLIQSYLERCGIPTDVQNLTVGLGSGGVSPLSHAVAYSVFANGGMRYDPVLVTEIFDRDGMQRYNYRDFSRAEQALDPKVAYVSLSMLEGVCKPAADYGYYPTAWRAHVLNRPCGGKTGTTNDSRDAWFCGFTPEFTAVVWVGYRDNRSLGHGADYTGGRLACPIWVSFMEQVHEGLGVEDFKVPPGIEFFDIDRKSGTRGGKYKEAYVQGTAPPLYTPPPPPAEDQGIMPEEAEEDIPLLLAL